MTILEMIDAVDRLVSNNGAISEIKPIIIPLREQAEALEARVRTLESKSKVKRLEGEVDFLKAELDSALQQIQELEKKQNAHASDDTLKETQILCFMAGQTGITTERIASLMKMGEEKTQLHLDDLVEAEEATCVVNASGQVCWYLETKGRRRLSDQGLLK